MSPQALRVTCQAWRVQRTLQPPLAHQVPPLAIVPALVLLFVGLVLVIRSGDRRVPSESPPI